MEGDLTVHGDIDETRAQLLLSIKLSIKLRLYHKIVHSCKIYIHCGYNIFQGLPMEDILSGALQDCEEICSHCMCEEICIHCGNDIVRDRDFWLMVPFHSHID